MHHHNEEGFKGLSVVSQRFWNNIDEARKILSFVGVNPKAKEFFPEDSSQMIKDVLAYIKTVLQKNAEKEAEDICHCRKRILSIALKNLCGNPICIDCKKSFQETCLLLVTWDFSCPHDNDFARKKSYHEVLLTGLLQYCFANNQTGPNCLTYLDTNTYSSSFEDKGSISGNDDSGFQDFPGFQDRLEEDAQQSTEEESYNPYSDVENLTQEFSGVSRSSEIVYYQTEWNPYNETYFNV